MGLGYGDPREADHINRNKLDNRKANLRVVTHAQNTQNLSSHSDSQSRYRGVARLSGVRAKPWQAYGTVDGKRQYLGTFATEQEAADAAAAWRREHLPFTTEQEMAA
jgi:hypothetical protein